MPKKIKTPITSPVPVIQPAPVQQTSTSTIGANDVGLIRMYVYDGTYYQTGVLDTDAASGKQCLNPDPQSFTSIEDMINYAYANGESLQQVTVDQVNSLCSGQLPYGGIQQGANCCLCQGGGARNFVPGAGNVTQPPGAGVLPSDGQVITINTPQNVVAGRVINDTRRKPINTIVF